MMRFESRAAFVICILLPGCAGGLRPSMTGRELIATSAPKPRVVVTTDPELDDSNSLLRYLLYSTDFRTEGLVYASSQYHWKGDSTGKKWAATSFEDFLKSLEGIGERRGHLSG